MQTETENKVLVIGQRQLQIDQQTLEWLAGEMSDNWPEAAVGDWECWGYAYDKRVFTWGMPEESLEVESNLQDLTQALLKLLRDKLEAENNGQSFGVRLPATFDDRLQLCDWAGACDANEFSCLADNTADLALARINAARNDA